MLNGPTNTPNEHLASYVDLFLRQAPWLRRRVETIAFLDVDTVVRRTTLDVGIAEVTKATTDCPFFPDRPLVPLALLKKDLLVDFDLRDRQGGALAVAPRDVDSFFAWSALCAEGKRVLAQEVRLKSPAVEMHLRELVFKFPEPEDDPFDATLRSWEAPAGWADPDRQVWRSLLEDEPFARLLRDFTFNFLLLTQLETGSSLQLVKFSYQQYLPYSQLLRLERLGVRATELDIIAPSVGWARSYHLQIEVPQGLTLTEVGLFRTQRQALTTPLPAESYEARVRSESAQVYTTSSIKPADHVVAVTMRVPVFGYLRAMWLASVASAVVLVTARWQLPRVQAAAEQRADAAVALLLVAPSVLAAYIVRPGEHVIASRLLRPLRYAVAGTGCLSYIAAAVLVLGWRNSQLRTAWTVIASIASLIAIAITIVVYLTKRDLIQAAKSANDNERRTILVVQLDDD